MPGWLKFDSTSLLTISPTSIPSTTDLGSYSMYITATVGYNSLTKNLYWRIVPNSAPKFASWSPLSTTAYTSVPSFTITGVTDREGESITYSVLYNGS
jgi:hypothetical protein